ncbi:MAG: excinuclease ABC subunit UvrC, partial [bacterium]|nr:excinuclease ABC subunit UvrC [bacterium]
VRPCWYATILSGDVNMNGKKRAGAEDTPARSHTGSPEVSLEEKLSTLPAQPGCYLYKDAKGKVIYVGKAKSLRSRVRSYFSGRSDGRALFNRLVNAIRDVETIIVESEREALILENNLIKHHKPKFNIDLKDDRSYPYLKITNEPFPRIFLIRHPKPDKARYLGPFMEVTAMRGLIRELKKVFRIRTCDLNITADSVAAKRHKICLQYHMKQCDGPCEGLTAEAEYNAHVKSLIDILNGKTSGFEREWQERMYALSAQKRFEEAALARDQLTTVRHLATRQKVMSVEPYDRDALGIFREDEEACIAILRIRNGKMVGRLHYFLAQVNPDDTDADVLSTFLLRHYATADVPPEITVPCDDGEWKTVADAITELRDAKCRFDTPKIGDKAGQVRIANANAELLFNERKLARQKREFVPQSMKGLQELLKLPMTPKRIECFDISHLAGTNTVASMVCFDNAKALRSEYKKFIVKTVEGIDDFASMKEVVGRRYRRLIAEQKPLPDVILIDGGKGQLSAALEAITEAGIPNHPIIGLAKRIEEVFLPGESDSRILPRTSSVLRVLQQIRDEAHRFAVTFQQQRRKVSLLSRLDEIPGVGEHRRNELLKRFGSVNGIRDASLEEIAETANIGAKLAQAILDALTKAK